MASHRIALLLTAPTFSCGLRLHTMCTLFPLYVIWGKSEWKDGLDVSPEQFYERMVSEPAGFSTHFPTQPADFANIFGQLRRRR